jgi:AmmeMemoRadiSam system protein A
MSRVLSAGERRALLDLARASIAAAVHGRTGVIPPTLDWPDASGVFVTIKRRGALRGCLGTLRPRRDLGHEVIRCAIDSSQEDPRFPPLSRDELDEIDLEISVLGPLERISADPAAFTIGVHGLVIEDGHRRGLLLPQVAIEWGWTAEEFLCQTCVKASLKADAWRRGARVYRFAAEVFGD